MMRAYAIGRMILLVVASLVLLCIAAGAREPAYGQTPKCDLEIDNSGPTLVDLDGKATFKVEVHNAGEGGGDPEAGDPCGPPVVVKERIEDSEEWLKHCTVKTNPSGAEVSISGDTIIIKWLNIWLAPCGSVSATIECNHPKAAGQEIKKTGEVDPDDDVPEPNEGNNKDEDLSDDPKIPPPRFSYCEDRHPCGGECREPAGPGYIIEGVCKLSGDECLCQGEEVPLAWGGTTEFSVEPSESFASARADDGSGLSVGEYAAIASGTAAAALALAASGWYARRRWMR